MTEAQRCRELAEIDRRLAAETDLAMVKARHLLSASVWQARADMCERTGLKAIVEEVA